MIQKSNQKVQLLLMLIVLTLTGSMEVKGETYQNVTFNDGVRYSQWTINSRIRDFRGNTKRMGFNTYNSAGELQGSDISSGYWWNNDTGSKTRNFTIDYVAGLVAKAIIENVDYNKEKTWAKPWYFSVQNYANQITAPNTGGSQDNMNAVKMYFALNSLASGAYSSLANAGTTTTKASTAFTRTATAFGDLNSNYAIGGPNSNSYYRLTEAAGGWFHKAEYKDQMWCDGLYMGSALLAQLINQTGVTTNISGSTNDWEIIYNQIRISWSQLYDSSKGLLYHAFTASPQNNMWSGVTETGETFHSAAFWGRACGWYMLALVDILEQMKIAGLNESSHPQYSYYTTLKGYLNSLAEGIKNYQDNDTKCWYQVLDEKDNALSGNYIEASCSAIFTAAYFKGIRLGLYDKDYSSVAENAYRACVAQFLRTKEDGTLELINSCASAGLNSPSKTGRNGSRSYYISGSDVTKITDYTEGKIFGAFILAATEYERAYQASKAILFSTDLKASYDLEANESITIEACGADGAQIDYQWYKDGVAVNGATSATITPTASGAYYCKATSGTTTIQSSTANVTVPGVDTETPVFTTDLAATATATVGTAKTLTVAASHADGYQWYSNTTASNTGGTEIENATSASYTFTPSAAGTLYYYCVATNSNATGTQSVASAVCTVTVNEAPEMWTAAGATYNSTSKGYEVEGRGTYYKATSGGTAEESEDNTATWAAGTYRLKTSNNLFIYSLANSVSGLKVYMRGSGNRTLSSVATASSLNGSYSTLTNNTDYTYSSTCTGGSYITTSDTRDVVTFTFTSALAAGTVVQITLSGNAYIYGIEPVIASQKTVNTLALSTESDEVTVGNTLDISSYVSTNSDATITYTSNNDGVASVTDAGVISGVAEGEATITVAQAETEEYTAGSATFTITVTATPTTNYIVTFYNGNTFYGSLTIDEGATVEAPAISPTKQGYTFKGWALENGSTARVLFPYLVYSDVNFYAVWSEDTGGGSGEDETIFSASGKNEQTISGNTIDQKITSDYATISGGEVYATNAESSNKKMIQSRSSIMSFRLAHNDSYFKVVLDKALVAGDKIGAFVNYGGSQTRGIWFSASSTRPSSEPAAKLVESKTSSGWYELTPYTVTTGDGICGQNTFYIYRATADETFLNNFTITRKGQGDNITLDAATDYENFDDYVGEGKNVTLRRNFTEGKWTTLVLPFSVTTQQLVAAFDHADDCELAKITSMNVDTQGKGSIHYITVNSIEANKPVLARIKPNESGEYVFSGVTVVAPTSDVVSTSEEDGNIEMHGVYKTTSYTQISEDAYFLSGGKFYDWSYLNAMSPFSAYILPVGDNQPQPTSLAISMEETGIENVNANGNGNANENESYNLAGQRVTKEYNGIVIIKGKKVFTK